MKLVFILISLINFNIFADAKKDFKSQYQITKHNQDLVSPGFVLLPVEGTEEILLIDNYGEVKNVWPLDTPRAKLNADCTLTLIHASGGWGKYQKRWRDLRREISIYDWGSNKIWNYKTYKDMHHDFEIVGDKFYLLEKRYIQVPAKEFGYAKEIRNEKIRVETDRITHINKKGDLLWEWSPEINYNFHYFGNNKDYKNIINKVLKKKKIDWTHINSINVIPQNKWYPKHREFKPGNLIIQPRNWWQVIILNPETKKVVWEYSGDFMGGLIHGHDAHMIPEGYPGAGHILIFDNGLHKYRAKSIILEVNPVTKKVIWSYYEKNSFFSYRKGSAQRLKNGNTFISNGHMNKVFEVTPDKEVVWFLKSKKPINRAHRYEDLSCLSSFF